VTGSAVSCRRKHLPMAIVSRKSVLAASVVGSQPAGQDDEVRLEFGAAQATAPRRREINWLYMTPLVFLFLPLVNYLGRS
jgi:hypothetical protein